MTSAKIFVLSGVLALTASASVGAAPSSPPISLPLSNTQQLAPTNAQFSSDGRFFAGLLDSIPYSSEDKEFCAWSTRTGQVSASWHLKTLNAFALAPQGRSVAVISERGISDEHYWHGGYEVDTVQIRDFYSGQIKKTLIREGATSAHIYSLAWSNDGRFLATGSGDGIARIWNVASGRRVTLLKMGGYVGSLQFSPDGSHLATVSGYDECGATVNIWNWRQKKSLESRTLAIYSTASTLTFSGNGKYLAVGDTSKGTTTLVSGDQLQLCQTPPFPIGVSVDSYLPTPQVAFSPGSGLLACANGNDLVVRSLAPARFVMRHRVLFNRMKKSFFGPFADRNPYILCLQFLSPNQLRWVTFEERFRFIDGGSVLISPRLHTLTIPPHN